MCKDCCCSGCTCLSPKSRKTRLVWFSIIIGILLAIFFCLYFAGYYERVKWNWTAQEVTCTISAHYFRNTNNHYWDACDCHNVCYADNCYVKCDSKCMGYYKIGIITVKYLDTYIKNVTVFGEDNTYKYSLDVYKRLEKDFPINSTIIGYIQPGKPDTLQLKFKMDSYTEWLVAAYFFLSLILFLVVLWAILDIIRCSTLMKSYCRRLQNRKKATKAQKMSNKSKISDEQIEVKPKDYEEVSKTMESAVSEVTEITVQ